MARMIGLSCASWACCRYHEHGYAHRNGAQRRREKLAVAREAQAEVDRYELDRLERLYGRSFYDNDGQCPRDGLQCTCNGDRCL